MLLTKTTFLLPESRGRACKFLCPSLFSARLCQPCKEMGNFSREHTHTWKKEVSVVQPAPSSPVALTPNPATADCPAFEHSMFFHSMAFTRTVFIASHCLPCLHQISPVLPRSELHSVTMSYEHSAHTGWPAEWVSFIFPLVPRATVWYSAT